MKKFIIKGLDGKQNLKGSYTVSGSKNSGLPALTLPFLFENEVVLKNMPEIEDIFLMEKIIKDLGLSVKKKKNCVKILSKKISGCKIDKKLGGDLRGSIILTGPVLARKGCVEFYFPGGCSIGKRPIDLFLSSFKKMGAKVSEKRNLIKITSKKLLGAEIILPVQSVTVTETIMITAVLAKGNTVIKNAAMEPEIEYLANYLNLCGAKIEGAGTSEIKIKGRDGKLLKAKDDIPFVNMADRIEAGSIAILAALSGKDIVIRHFVKKHLEIFLETFDQIGVKYYFPKKNILHIKKQNLKNFKSINLKTHEHPGFPTDLQSQIGVLLSQCKGESKIFETIFESRLSYLEGLKLMGSRVESWNIYQAAIFGPKKLKGKRLVSPDLRGGFAYIIAGILAKGQTEIDNSYVIRRGYENIIEKLQKIGVSIIEK